MHKPKIYRLEPLEKWMTLNSSSVFATKIEAYRHRGSTERLYKTTTGIFVCFQSAEAGPLEKWMTLNLSSVFATKIKACRHRGAALSPSTETQPQKAEHTYSTKTLDTRTTQEMDDA